MDPCILNYDKQDPSAIHFFLTGEQEQNMRY